MSYQKLSEFQQLQAELPALSKEARALSELLLTCHDHVGEIFTKSAKLLESRGVHVTVFNSWNQLEDQQQWKHFSKSTKQGTFKTYLLPYSVPVEIVLPDGRNCFVLREDYCIAINSSISESVTFKQIHTAIKAYLVEHTLTQPQ